MVEPIDFETTYTHEHLESINGEDVKPVHKKKRSRASDMLKSMIMKQHMHINGKRQSQD